MKKLRQRSGNLKKGFGAYATRRKKKIEIQVLMYFRRKRILFFFKVRKGHSEVLDRQACRHALGSLAHMNVECWAGMVACPSPEHT